MRIEPKHKDTPRDVLALIVASHPGASEAEIRRLFHQRALKNERILVAVIEQWFVENLRLVRQFRSLVIGDRLH